MKGIMAQMNKYKKVVLISLILLLILLFTFSVFFSIININNNKILNGISINEIDVSNLSKEDAKAKMLETINQKKQEDITFFLDENNQISSSYDNLEIEYSVVSTIDKAYNVGRSSNIFKNNYDILYSYFNKQNYNLDISFNNKRLEILLQTLSSNIENKVIQSSYYIENDKLVINKGIDGYDVDKNEVIEKFEANIRNLSSKLNTINVSKTYVIADEINIDKIYQEIYKDKQNAYYEKEPLKIYPEVIGISFDKEEAYKQIQEDKSEYEISLVYSYPEITLSNLDIDIFQDKLSTFQTKYNVSNVDRTTNLNLAASKINGTIIRPGEEFSYNKIVGARTIDAGYKEAKIYSNGEVVDGVGGGICQISSTLYNSVIMSNLKVTERHNHQFLTSYVDAGKDATVAYGSKDFRFKNTRSYPIKIELTVDNGHVSCAIYGIKEETEYDVVLDVETVNTIEPTITFKEDENLSYGAEKVIQKGSKGTVVNVYKVIKSNGNIISRTFISQDKYQSLERIILRNSGQN